MDNGIIVFSLKKKKTTTTFNILNTKLLGGNVNDSVFVITFTQKEISISLHLKHAHIPSRKNDKEGHTEVKLQYLSKSVSNVTKADWMGKEERGKFIFNY